MTSSRAEAGPAEGELCSCGGDSHVCGNKLPAGSGTNISLPLQLSTQQFLASSEVKVTALTLFAPIADHHMTT
jgi:hypothetical protein